MCRRVGRSGQGRRGGTDVAEGDRRGAQGRTCSCVAAASTTARPLTAGSDALLGRFPVQRGASTLIWRGRIPARSRQGASASAVSAACHAVARDTVLPTSMARPAWTRAHLRCMNAVHIKGTRGSHAAVSVWSWLLRVCSRLSGQASLPLTPAFRCTFISSEMPATPLYLVDCDA